MITTLALVTIWIVLVGFLIAFLAGAKKVSTPAPALGHEPLLEIDGRAIQGLKRCKYCGLSETYWGRFPVCEHYVV